MFSIKTLVSIAIVVASAGPGVMDATDTLKVTGGEVTVLCPLTVGGSFEARTNAVSGQVEPPSAPPGAVTGAVQVKLDTLSTGISLRDRHLRETYLEVTKGPDYAVAVLDNIRIDKAEGKGTFRGTLTLHGQKREVAGTTSVQKKDGQVRVTAEFPVKISEFQIAKPTYLGVGVKDEVQVKVSFATTAVPGTMPPTFAMISNDLRRSAGSNTSDTIINSSAWVRSSSRPRPAWMLSGPPMMLHASICETCSFSAPDQ